MHASSSENDRLTREEYEREVVALHVGQPPMPSKEQDVAIRRKEFDLLIDYQLGRSFPADRRETLWQTQRDLDRRRLSHLLWGAVRNPLDPGNGLVRAQVRGFSQVLDRRELAALFDLSPQDISRLTS